MGVLLAAQNAALAKMLHFWHVVALPAVYTPSTRAATYPAVLPVLQMLLQYAACISRCRGVPQRDREQLACRVGHLLSAYHSLAGLCSAAQLSLTAGVARPSLPLAQASLEAAAAAAAAAEAAAEGEGQLQQGQGLHYYASQDAGAGSNAADMADDGEEGQEAAEATGGTHTTEQCQQQGPGPEQGASPGESSDSPKATEGPAAATFLPAVASFPPTPLQNGRQVQQAHQGQQEEAAIGAVLRPYCEAVDELIACIAEEGQLHSWHFVLEYGEVASLASKQRLLLSLAAAWPRRRDGQLALNSGRSGLLQRVCSRLEERQLSACGDHSGRSMGGALWHGIQVAFEEVRPGGQGCCWPGLLHLPLPVATRAECLFYRPVCPALPCPALPCPPICRSPPLAMACGANGSACWLPSSQTHTQVSTRAGLASMAASGTSGCVPTSHVGDLLLHGACSEDCGICGG